MITMIIYTKKIQNGHYNKREIFKKYESADRHKKKVVKKSSIHEYVNKEI